MRTATRTTAVVALVLSLATLTAACSKSDSGGSSSKDTTTTTQGSTGTLTAVAICTDLAPTAVGTALGLEVGTAEPSTKGQPTCTYNTKTAGGSSTATVSALRPNEELGGKKGAEGYAYYLAGLKAFGRGTKYTEKKVVAGDQAVLFTSAANHSGLIQSGDTVIAVVVPAGDATPDQVAALMTAAAKNLG